MGSGVLFTVGGGSLWVEQVLSYGEGSSVHVGGGGSVHVGGGFIMFIMGRASAELWSYRCGMRGDN